MTDPNHLTGVVRLLPTPTTQDGENNGSFSQQNRDSLPLNAVMGGALNPDFVVWMMGFPQGWLDVE